MAELASPTAPASLTCSPGTWVASQGIVDGELQGFWDIKVATGDALYSYMQYIAMVFSATDHAEANAKLIAAAPAGLDLIRRVVDMYVINVSEQDIPQRWLKDARAYLDVVEGRNASR